MTPIDFANNITRLIREMEFAGERPIIHFAYRSKEEQKRLFDAKLTKCDGVIKKSDHQSMAAMDIYLTKNGKIVWEWDKKKAVYWHQIWEKEYGGKPMTVFSDGTVDAGHFN